MFKNCLKMIIAVIIPLLVVINVIAFFIAKINNLIIAFALIAVLSILLTYLTIRYIDWLQKKGIL